MKIKVKRVRGGSMGDQRNYGLVTGSIWNYEDKPSTNTVSGTMSPTDRENATIEAERGETVVGDLNNDGMLEHLKIGGKRHAQGGTPLNVPDGSFVFSDYRGLLIKNKELLSNVFGYKGGKSATPAKVARRYELNRYNDILNDPHADFLDQKTAQLMLDNNLKKLGQLALVQESMKGFPDGIPNIALPLFGSDVPAQKPQMMKKGGLVKYQARNSQTGKPEADNELARMQQMHPGNWLPEATVEGTYPPNYSGYRPGSETIEQYISRIESDPNFWVWSKSTGKTGMFDRREELFRNYVQGAQPQYLESAVVPEWLLPALGTGAYYLARPAFGYLGKAIDYLSPAIRKLPAWKRLPAIWKALGKKAPGIKRGIEGSAVFGSIYGLQSLFRDDDTEERPMLNKPGESVSDTTGTWAPTPQSNDSLLNSVLTGQPSSPTSTNQQVVVPQDTLPIRSTTGSSTNQRTVPQDSASYWGQSYRQRGGSTLPYAQAGNKGIGYFNIGDPELYALAGQDFEFDRPGYYPGWQSVGYQLPGSDPTFTRGASYEILPTRGIKNPQTGVAYGGIDDLIGYADPYVNFKDYDKGNGIAQWKKDVSSKDDKVREKAGRWYVDRVNAYNRSILGPNAPETIDTSKRGFWEMGSENLTVPFAKRKARPAAPAAPGTPAAEPVATDEATYEGRGFQGSTRPRDVGYWTGDLAAMGAAASQRIPDYLLTSARLTPSLMGPAYTGPNVDPYLGALNTYMQSVGVGPEGRGMGLSAKGAVGKTLAALNQEIQSNRASNLDMYNRAAAANMEAMNRANLYNTEEGKAYIDRFNTLLETNAREVNKKAAQMARLYGKMEKNRMNLNAMNAMMPYQYSDWQGTRVNPTLTSINQEAITGTGTGSNYNSLFESIYGRIMKDNPNADPAKAAQAAAAYATGAMRASGGVGTRGAATSIFDFLDTE